MLSRRDWLRITAGASAALGLDPRILEALQSQEVITRAIPSSGGRERLPVVGLGGANTYSQAARAEDFGTIGGVLRALLDGVRTVLDPAAGYGASEAVSGRGAGEPGSARGIWCAPPVTVAWRGGGGEAGAFGRGGRAARPQPGLPVQDRGALPGVGGVGPGAGRAGSDRAGAGGGVGWVVPTHHFSSHQGRWVETTHPTGWCGSGWGEGAGAGYQVRPSADTPRRRPCGARRPRTSAPRPAARRDPH